MSHNYVEYKCTMCVLKNYVYFSLDLYSYKNGYFKLTENSPKALSKAKCSFIFINFTVNIIMKVATTKKSFLFYDLIAVLNFYIYYDIYCTVM